MFQNILITMDDSQLVKNAIRYTANAFPDAKYHILTVLNTSEQNVPLSDILMEDLKESCKRAVKNGIDILEDMGIKDHEKSIRKGKPGEEIINYSEEKSIDLIVVGTQSKSGIQIYDIGATCLHVLEHSSKPVLVFDSVVEINTPKKLLHPNSGDRYSLKGGCVAIELAEYFGGEVKILSTRGGAETESTFKRLYDFAHEHDIPYHLRSCAVKPHDEIVKESKKNDLIVGSLGRPGLKYELRMIYPPFAVGELEREVLVEARKPILFVE